MDIHSARKYYFSDKESTNLNEFYYAFATQILTRSRGAILILEDSPSLDEALARRETVSAHIWKMSNQNL